MSILGNLIRIANIPLRVIDETLSVVITGEGTSNRDERLISGPLSDVADGVDEIEESIKNSFKGD